MNEQLRYEQNLIVRILLSVFGTMGIINVCTTGLALRQNYQTSSIEFLCGTIVAGLTIVILALLNSEARKWVWVYFSVISIVVLLGLKWAIKGLRIIGYEFEYQVFGGVSVESITGQKLTSLAVDINFAISIVGIVIGIIVAVQIWFIPNMIAPLIICMPFLGVMIYFDLMPSSMSIIFCVIYIFGSAFIGSRKSDASSGIYIIPAIFIICSIILFICPQKSFEQSQFFKDAKVLVTDIAREKFGIELDEAKKGEDEKEQEVTDSKALGVVGIGDGLVGQIDELRFSGNKIGRLSTNSTGNPLYITYGIGIFYEDNNWNIDSEETKLELYFSPSHFYKSSVWYSYENNNQLQLYAKENIDNYDDRYIKRNYSFTGRYLYGDLGSLEETELSNQTLDETLVLSNGFNKFLYGDYDVYLTPSEKERAKSMKESKERIYQNNLDVPEKTAEVIEDIFGKRKAETNEEIIEYVKYVRDYLKINYRYSINPGKVPEGRETAEYFLTDGKKGYCTYFATAGTLILRQAGIPARYCVGYKIPDEDILNGEPGANDTRYKLDVTDEYAHAWIEFFLEGYGWVTVDMTASDMPGQEQISSEFNQEINSDIQPGNISGIVHGGSSDDSNSSQEITTQSDNQSEDENRFDFKLNRKLVLNLLSGAGIILLATFFIILIIKCIKRKRLFNPDRDINAEKAFKLYICLEKELKSMGIKKESSLDYEAFVNKAKDTVPALKETDIDNCIKIVLRIRFSESKDVDKEDITDIINTIREVREIARKEKRNR